MNNLTEELRHNYDAVPYPSTAFTETHPESLNVVAALNGLSAPKVDAARILEIGCASGGNLLPMAQSLPSSRFLGIDLSPRQIQIGNEIVQKLSLPNIELRCQNILDFDPAEGTFDYIIAHGIYSWVPADVREKLLQICKRNLTPTGVAYISYNTLPGWHLRRIGRDFMLRHSRNAINGAERITHAREILAWASTCAAGIPSYRATLQDHADHFAKNTADYLLHDDLEAVNEPVYLEQFVQHAAAHGLRHLAAASPSMEAFQWLAPAMQEKIRVFAPDSIQQEQYLDFLHGRLFRSSLLCHADVKTIDQAASESILNMHISGELTEEPFAGASGQGIRFGSSLSKEFKLPITDSGLLAAFRHIKQAYPRSVPFAELRNMVIATQAPGAGRASSAIQTLAQNIFVAYKAYVVELSTRPIEVAATIPPRPLATPLARLQASSAAALVNLRHRNIMIDPIMKDILPLLDGIRDHAAICSELARLLDTRQLLLETPAGPLTSKDDLQPFVEGILQTFVTQSLLLP